MSVFAHEVLRQIDRRCLADGIDKGGCKASLTDAPPDHAVVDLDAPGAPLGLASVRCDYLFFADPNLVAPIEIKNSEPNVVRAARQLQAGANAADRLLPRGREIVCRPVLVSKNATPEAERTETGGGAVSRTQGKGPAHRLRRSVDRGVRDVLTVRRP